MLKEASKILLKQLSSIQQIKYVDMYYSQDESKVNIIKFPALLLNVVNAEYEAQSKSLDKKTTNFGLLLLVKEICSNKEKEFKTLDLLDIIYFYVKSLEDFKMKGFSCIERSSNLTVYFIEVVHETLLDSKQIFFPFRQESVAPRLGLKQNGKT
ncbi:MAG: hypothetical protein FWG98_06755 [Candidatus Cloacimonetes bacterium]|nr:hypothetical protein [Candidatus Cloacimonadota bacterium]